MTAIERPPNYEVWLCTDLGERLALLSPVAFDYVMGVGEVGAFSVLMPGTFPRSLLEVDRQVQFWRRHRGRNSLELDQVGFLRRWKYETDGRGLTTLKLSGPDIQELLYRRIIAYAAGTANAGTVTAVDDGMKDIFNVNFLAAATDGDRDISGNEVTVQNDLGDGGSITKSFSWRNVMDVLQELNAASRTAGTEVFFRLVWQGIDENDRLQLQFRTYTGQPGKDLTYPNSSIVFGLEFGNLVEPSLEYDHTNEINYVYAGGQGEGADREIVEVSDLARIKKSAWNRREGFKDARNESTTAGVTAAGNAMLAEFRPRERFSGTIMDTKFTPYGSGWRLGDRLPVTYIGRQFDEILRKVAVKVSQDGETIRGAFEGGRLITDPVIDEIVGTYAKMQTLLNNLATRENTKYKGVRASDFTTAELPHSGDYGAYNLLGTYEIQVNVNGTVRSIATSAL